MAVRDWPGGLAADDPGAMTMRQGHRPVDGVRLQKSKRTYSTEAEMRRHCALEVPKRINSDDKRYVPLAVFTIRTYGREAATGLNKRVACIVDISLLKRCPANSLENHLQNRLRGFQSRANVLVPVVLGNLPCREYETADAHSEAIVTFAHPGVA